MDSVIITDESQEIKVNYKSYNIPYVVRLIQPRLYKKEDIFFCILKFKDNYIYGTGVDEYTAMHAWAQSFRQHIEQIPLQEVNTYINHIRFLYKQD
ncbi:MAG: hypothetical protein QM768_18115 [Agriterribacter sp.]